MSKRNVLSKKNVEELAELIRLYTASVRDTVRWKLSDNIAIENLINNMIIDEKLGAEDRKKLEKEVEEVDQKEAKLIEARKIWDREREIEGLKSAGMLE